MDDSSEVPINVEGATTLAELIDALPGVLAGLLAETLADGFEKLAETLAEMLGDIAGILPGVLEARLAALPEALGSRVGTLSEMLPVILAEIVGETLAETTGDILTTVPDTLTDRPTEAVAVALAAEEAETLRQARSVHDVEGRAGVPLIVLIGLAEIDAINEEDTIGSTDGIDDPLIELLETAKTDPILEAGTELPNVPLVEILMTGREFGVEIIEFPLIEALTMPVDDPTEEPGVGVPEDGRLDVGRPEFGVADDDTNEVPLIETLSTEDPAPKGETTGDDMLLTERLGMFDVGPVTDDKILDNESPEVDPPIALLTLPVRDPKPEVLSVEVADGALTEFIALPEADTLGVVLILNVGMLEAGLEVKLPLMKVLGLPERIIFEPEFKTLNGTDADVPLSDVVEAVIEELRRLDIAELRIDDGTLEVGWLALGL